MSLDIWGDKWTLLIIRDLIFEGKQTYGQFLNSEESISTNILAARLNLLKEHGIVRTATNPSNRSSVLYQLTDKGIDLLPVLVEVHLWAENYLPVSDEIREALKVVKADKAAFIQNLADKLRRDSQNDDQE